MHMPTKYSVIPDLAQNCSFHRETPSRMQIYGISFKKVQWADSCSYADPSFFTEAEQLVGEDANTFTPTSG